MHIFGFCDTQLNLERKENILIDDACHVRLADFGLANFADASGLTAAFSPRGGAIRFRAPEILEPSLVERDFICHTPESDIYSAGQLAWEVCI